MTCIVAIKHNGNVFMGGDSAGAGGWRIVTRADQMIFRVGPMLIGFTTSFRMGQLLGFSLRLPDHDPRVSVEQYMCTSFVDAVRQCLKDGGFATVESAAEAGGIFLVGYQGRIFRVERDYQIGESRDDFDAVGCGEDIALGSLFSTAHMWDEPEARLQLALNAAQRFSNGVRGPFMFMSESP